LSAATGATGAATRTCTQCATGYKSGANAAARAAITDCTKCAATEALNLATKACITIPNTVTSGKVTGGRVYTIATDATTSVILIECDTAAGYK